MPPTPKTKTPLLAIFAVLLALVVLVLYWKQTQRVRALEESAALTAARQTELQEQLDEASLRRADLERELVSLRQASLPQPTPSAGPAITPASPALRPQTLPTMNDGVLQRSLASSIRNSLDVRYASLFRRLKLPPEQLEQLKNLLVDRQAALFDVMAAARMQGLVGPEHAREIQGLVQQTQEEVDAQIRDLLGAENFERYQDHQSHAQHYAVAEQLERRLSYTDTPLRPEQLEELVRILRNASAADPTASPANTVGAAFAAPGGGRFIAGPMVSATLPALSDDTIEQAGRTLSPAQLAALKQLQAEQRDQHAMIGAATAGSSGETTTIQVLPAPIGGGPMPRR